MRGSNYSFQLPIQELPSLVFGVLVLFHSNAVNTWRDAGVFSAVKIDDVVFFSYETAQE
jgi:hypothetical protein